MSNFSENIKSRVVNTDWILVILVFITTGYGLMLVKSTTNYTKSPKQMIVQCVAIGIGIVCIFFMSSLDYDHTAKYSNILYGFSLLLLVMTLMFGTGEEDTGNKSWIRIPGIDVGGQPSEIVKILFIITFAKHLDKIKEKINKPLNVLLLIVHIGVILGLIMLQKDLGTALVFIFIFIVMCFVSGMSGWYFLGGAFMVTVLSPLIWSFLQPYQQERILVGFKPELDPEHRGYQALQSRFAIGSGGIFGKGYQKGPMTQRLTGSVVPAQPTDMIFSAAGEEFGIFGTLLVIVLLSLILIRVYRVSRIARNDLGNLMCMGVFAMFTFQSIENIGMCLGRLPVIGITLPFFSYGGSSILASYLGIGVVLAVYARRNIYYFNSDEEFS